MLRHVWHAMHERSMLTCLPATHLTHAEKPGKDQAALDLQAAKRALAEK